MSFKRLANKTVLILTVIFFLTGCQAFGQPSAKPLPTVVLGSQATPPAPATQSAGTTGGISNDITGSVTASGIVVAAQDANLALVLGGKVVKVNVAVGDQVSPGQVLVELDTTDIQIQINQAKRNLMELTSQASIAAAEKAVADAQSAVIQDQKDLKTAKLHRSYLNYDRGTDDQVGAARAAYLLAQTKVDQFQSVYDHTKGDPTTDASKALALSNLQAAKTQRDKALENLNWYLGKPSTQDFSEADANVAVAQANLDTANSTLQEAQWYIAVLKGESVPANATGSKLAQLGQAKDDLAAAQKKLEDASLVTMIPGTITAVNVIPGEITIPNEVLVTISDVSKLHVETTDLSERDVPKVKVGQFATVTVKALNQNVKGHVTLISPIAGTLGGDVVYKTTITLDTVPASLLAGMSVNVQFNAGP